MVLHHNSTAEERSSGVRLFFCGFAGVACSCGVDVTSGAGVWLGPQFFPCGPTWEFFEGAL